MLIALIIILILLVCFAVFGLYNRHIVKRRASTKKTEKVWKVKNDEYFPDLTGYLDGDTEIPISLRGYSMRPFLEDSRDRALLKKLEHYQVGDPVLAEILPGKWVLHRIIKIDGDDITLLGDGNLTPEYCHRQDLRAEIVGFYRKGKTFDRIDGWKWRVYSWFWMHLRPIRFTRRIALAIYRRWIKLFGPI